MVNKAGNNREVAFDYLRTAAAFFVVIIHTCAAQWNVLDVNSSQWVVLHIYNMLAKFSVPVFFMISGRFFLDTSKDIPQKKMLKKGTRIIAAFVFWSAVYMALNVFRVAMSGDSLKENIKWIIIEFFSGEYHMWFLYAILGLYLVTPLLRKITENKKLTEYFLILFFVFGLVWPLAERLPKVGVLFTNAGTAMSFHMTVGFAGYYVLGYYLYKYPVKGSKAKIMYILGAAGLVFTVLATFFISRKTGKANEEMAQYLTPGVALTAAAVYTAFLKIFANKKISKPVQTISKYSFGCYLAHPLFLWIFEWIGFVPTAFCTVISVPLIAACAMALSLLLTWVFNKIPLLRGVV